MKKIILLFMSVMGLHSIGYGQLNEYKYIVVPTKFEGFKSENQFQTSTLVKYLLTNAGYNAVYSNALPDDLEENPCLGLRTELVDESGLFVTKTKLSLTDCNGILVFMTQEGKTKTKDFKQAYKESISEAFGSLRGLNYKYEPSNKEETSAESITVSFKNDVKSLEDEVAKETVIEDRVEEEATKVIEEENEVKQPVITPTNETERPNVKAKGVLYAQPIEGGYQLVDTTPKVVYVLKSTSSPDVFLVNKDGKNGVVIKNDDKWFLEMDEKGGKAKELNIKF